MMNVMQLEHVPEREVFPGFRARFVHSGQMTIAHWVARAGSSVPEHAHPHEQIVHIVGGEFELTVDGVRHPMAAGSVFVIPPNVRHAGRAITDCRIIDSFHPVREDYR